MSSGLGTSKVNRPVDIGEDCGKLRLRRFGFSIAFDGEVGSTDFKSTFLFPLSLWRTLSSELEDIRRSSTSKEANAEGNARELTVFGKNMGDTGGVKPKSRKSSSEGCLGAGFSFDFLLFITSFDFFDSTIESLLFDDRGRGGSIGDGGEGGVTVRDCRL